jgi:hypothetical protein
MRALVNSVTYWDVVCLNKIFGLDGKKLVSITQVNLLYLLSLPASGEISLV